MINRSFVIPVCSVFLFACSGGGSGGGGNSENATTPTAERSTPQACTGADAAFAEEMLTSINNYRAQARSCGSNQMAAAPALSWNCNLVESSRRHSDDMATNNFFNHTGSDGLSAGDRITASGYRWRTFGENIAAGQRTAAQVMEGWINSPGHCSNIMNPDVTEVGAALVTNSGSDFSHYWTQNFAAPAQ